MSSLIMPLSLFIFPFCLLSAMVSDVRRFLIPNEFSIALLIGFLGVFPLTGLGWGAFADHLIVGGIAFIIGFILWMLGVFGAGDAKIISVAVLWLGPEAAIPGGLYVTLIGGAMAISVVAIRALIPYFPQLRPCAPRFFNTICEQELGKVKTPYGVAIALGCLLAFPESDIGQTLWFGMV